MTYIFKFFVFLIYILIITGKAYSEDYTIRGADIVVPDQAKLGKFRRTIRPFTNWSMICDEFLDTKKRLCNITQNVFDNENNLIFSWSMATSVNGIPLIIIRAYKDIDNNKNVAIKFEGKKNKFEIKFNACDINLCVTYLNLNKNIIKLMEASKYVIFSYSYMNNKNIMLRLPVTGLFEAIKEI